MSPEIVTDVAYDNMEGEINIQRKNDPQWV